MNSPSASSRIFMSWMSEYLSPRKLRTTLPSGVKTNTPAWALVVDVSLLVNHDAAVARPDHRLPIGAEAPARHRVERHQPAPHPHGLRRIRRKSRQREARNQSDSNGNQTVLHDRDSMLFLTVVELRSDPDRAVEPRPGARCREGRIMAQTQGTCHQP